MRKITDDEPENGTEVKVGKYVLNTSYNGGLWLYGPDGDGMQLDENGEAALEEIIAKFFKESM